MLAPMTMALPNFFPFGDVTGAESFFILHSPFSSVGKAGFSGVGNSSTIVEYNVFQ
jgi:hypothetical protein